MKINLFDERFTSPVWWSNTKNGEIEGHVKFDFVFGFFRPFFIVSVANKTFSHCNPLVAMAKAMESESVGMAKYNALKERIRDLGLHRSL